MENVKPVLEQLFSTFGTLLIYKTDNGSPFQSHHFAELAKKCGFEHRRITPYCPRANVGAESFMKKLEKVLKTAQITGQDKQATLRTFLTAYRETPDATTGYPAALLLMGYSRSSGFPQIDQPHTDHKYLSDVHKQARINDNKAKFRMKAEFDERTRWRMRDIGVGSLVLLKRPQTSKDISPWDPDPFRVTSVKGSLITAYRKYPLSQTIARNSAFFKLYHYDGSEDEVEGGQAKDIVRGGIETPWQDHVGQERSEPRPDEVGTAGQTDELERPKPAETEQIQEARKAKVGRPTHQEVKEREEKSQAALAAKRLAKPPVRSSRRLADLPPV